MLLGHPLFGCQKSEGGDYFGPHKLTFLRNNTRGRLAGPLATLALQYIGLAVSHAIFLHMGARFCLFLFLFVFCFCCFGALVYVTLATRLRRDTHSVVVGASCWDQIARGGEI